MAELRPHLEPIRQAGGEVVIVGTGDPLAAASFREDLAVENVEVFSDERREAFDRAGFRRGIGTLLSPRAVGNYLRAFLSGHRPKRRQGDALQQGGVLVVAPDETVYYRHASRASGDHPDVADLLAAVRTASMNSSLPKSPAGEKIPGR